jgi:hypothetical protein
LARKLKKEITKESVMSTLISAGILDKEKEFTKTYQVLNNLIELESSSGVLQSQ